MNSYLMPHVVPLLGFNVHTPQHQYTHCKEKWTHKWSNIAEKGNRTELISEIAFHIASFPVWHEQVLSRFQFGRVRCKCTDSTIPKLRNRFVNRCLNDKCVGMRFFGHTRLSRKQRMPAFFRFRFRFRNQRCMQQQQKNGFEFWPFFHLHALFFTHNEQTHSRYVEQYALFLFAFRTRGLSELELG